MTMHTNTSQARSVSDGMELSTHIQSLAVLFEQADRIQQKAAEIARELSASLDRLQTNPLPAADTHFQSPARRKRRCRKASSTLSKKEQQVWASVYAQGKTVTQTAMEFSCTPQNISKHLNNAQRKINARQSRSADTTRPLPEDHRGQVSY